MIILSFILSIIVLFMFVFIAAFYTDNKDDKDDYNYVIKVYSILSLLLLLCFAADVTCIYYVINPIVKGTYIKTSIYESDTLETVSYSLCKKIALGTDDCTVFKKVRRKITKTYGEPVTELFEIKEN